MQADVIDPQETGRGTGRTRAMVEALPPSGCIVVVHSGMMRDYVRRMVRDLRGEQVERATRVVVVEHKFDTERLRGLDHLPIFIDHWWTSVSRPEVIAEVEALRRWRLM